MFCKATSSPVAGSLMRGVSQQTWEEQPPEEDIEDAAVDVGVDDDGDGSAGLPGFTKRP